MPTDDAPLWAEVCGVVFVLGFLFRWIVHVFAGGELYDGDIAWPASFETLQSPVEEIRGTGIEVFATVVSVITGALLWLVTPTGVSPVTSVVFGWITLQTIPLLGDPVALVIAQYRDVDVDTESHDMSNTQPEPDGSSTVEVSD